jgi:hypothetical protein
MATSNPDRPKVAKQFLFLFRPGVPTDAEIDAAYPALIAAWEKATGRKHVELEPWRDQKAPPSETTNGDYT